MGRDDSNDIMAGFKDLQYTQDDMVKLCNEAREEGRDEIKDTVVSLVGIIEGLLLDGKRLDWIEEKQPLGLLDVASTGDSHSYGFSSISGDKTLYESFRMACDSAMESE